MLWLWKRIWEKHFDLNWERDSRLYNELKERHGIGAVIEKKIVKAAMSEAHKTNDMAKHIERWLFSGSLKYVNFSAPNESFRLTKTPPKRTPLGGRRFRSPLRSDGTKWGPAKMDRKLSPLLITAQEAYGFEKRIRTACKGLAYSDQINEIVQDVLVAILEGSMDPKDIESKARSFIASSGARYEEKSLSINDWDH